VTRTTATKTSTVPTHRPATTAGKRMVGTGGPTAKTKAKPKEEQVTEEKKDEETKETEEVKETEETKEEEVVEKLEELSLEEQARLVNGVESH